MADQNRLSTLANGLRVLEHLVERPMSMRELATAAALPRQTTYRIVATLITEGWVDRDGETYRASPRMWSLAAQSFSLTDLRDALSGTVPRLADEHGESVHLAVYDPRLGRLHRQGRRLPPGRQLHGPRRPRPGVLRRDRQAAAGVRRRDDARAGHRTRPARALTADAHPAPTRCGSSSSASASTGTPSTAASGGSGSAASPSRCCRPSMEVVAALGFSGPSDRILARLDELVLALREATGADGLTAPVRSTR